MSKIEVNGNVESSALIQSYLEVGRKHRVSLMGKTFITFVCIVGFCLTCFIGFFFIIGPLLLHFSFVVFWVIACISVLISLKRNVNNMQGQQEECMEHLVAQEDVQSIGFMLMILESPPSERIKNLLKPTIVRLLGKVTVENGGVLSDKRMEFLRSEILPFGSVMGLSVKSGEKLRAGIVRRKNSTSDSLPLDLAIIDLFGRIGGTKEQTVLSRLVRMQPSTENDHIILERAQSALQSLNRRLETQRLSRNLLRPSSNHDEDSETLLRPAGNVDADSATLLRPTKSESVLLVSSD